MKIIPFKQWFTGMGVTRITAWRWRKKGLIKPVNIHSKLYVHEDEIARFEARALAGEFAQESTVRNER